VWAGLFGLVTEAPPSTDGVQAPLWRPLSGGLSGEGHLPFYSSTLSGSGCFGPNWASFYCMGQDKSVGWNSGCPLICTLILPHPCL
jgi:hypothetical protein